MDSDLEEIKARLDELERLWKENRPVGVLYSRLQGQLTEVFLRVKGLEALLRELVPDFDSRYEAVRTNLKRLREKENNTDYFQ